MKTIMNHLTAIALFAVASIMATASFAADPRAEVFFSAGCDADHLKPVLSADGETVLYWQNVDGKGCDASKRGGFRDDVANGLVVVEAPIEEPTEVASK